MQYFAVPRLVLAAGSLALLGFPLSAMSDRPAPEEEVSVSIPNAGLHFYTDKQGFTVAKGWGDPDNGAHGNFMKIPGATASGRHTHSFSYYGVVISGIVANEPTAETPVRPLGPGSYWYQKGGEPHVTRCISTTECLFFVTARGTFDYLPVK